MSIRRPGLVTDVQDAIAQVLKPPAARGSYAVLNTGRMHMPAVVDAIGFALEVATFVDGKLGRELGVLTAVTGNRSQMGWIGYADSLAQVEADGQTLERDPDYLAFFKRSEGLFEPGSLEQSIWQLLP